jgi:hypothetical protein
LLLERIGKMVFTAAALAVTAAVTLGTVASIATAVVAVSAAVGVVGLAVTAVGMITKNEDLLGVGKIMGYVGLAGGIAGGVIGGLGGLAEGGAGFLAGAKGAYTGYADKLGEAGAKYASFFDDAAGAKVMAPVDSAVPGAGNPNFTQAPGAQPGIGAAPSTSTGAASPHPFSGPNNPGSIVSTPSPSVAGQIPVAQQNLAAITKSAAGGTISPNELSYMQQIGNAGGSVAKTPGILESTPDWMKYSAATAGLQGLSGMAGGYFQGQSAEEQLALQKLKNEQEQAQIQRINQNNSYSPRLTFNQSNGLINR